MNITFTGTEDHAATFSFICKDDGSVDFVNTLTCTLNDEGKKNLTELEPTLAEYKNPIIPRDSIVITAKNKLSKANVRELNSNFNKFLEKYNPHCDSITINGKEVIQSKNRKYIFKKLQELTEDILNIKDAYLFMPIKLDKKRVARNLGEDLHKDKYLAQALSVMNIKSNTNIINKSLEYVYRRIR